MFTGWWQRWRWWGVYQIPGDSGMAAGWYVPKTAWMPPVVAFIVFLAIRPFVPLVADWWGGSILLGVPWAVLVVHAYVAYTEGSTKYPLTDAEACIAAGMTNIYQCPHFQAWLNLHGLRMAGIITFNYQDGQIRSGGAAWDSVRAKRGLPQVEGRVGIANDYHWYHGFIYDKVWMEYATRFGNQAMLSQGPPKHYGIPPQPSIPK